MVAGGWGVKTTGNKIHCPVLGRHKLKGLERSSLLGSEMLIRFKKMVGGTEYIHWLVSTENLAEKRRKVG